MPSVELTFTTGNYNGTLPRQPMLLWCRASPCHVTRVQWHKCSQPPENDRNVWVVATPLITSGSYIRVAASYVSLAFEPRVARHQHQAQMQRRYSFSDGVKSQVHGRMDREEPKIRQLLKRLCQEGRLDEALRVLRLMEQEGFVACKETYLSLFQGCIKMRALAEARLVHAHIIQKGHESDLFLGNSVVNMFVRCGSFSDAMQAFSRLPRRNAFSWTAIISWYSNAGRGREALLCYQQMQEEGIAPSKYTFLSILRACGSLEDLGEGTRIHNDILKSCCEADVFLGTALVDMYAKCGSVVDARQVFDSLEQPDVVAWTAMVAGYAQHGQGEKALQLFAHMERHGVKPNDRTFVSVLQACGSLALLEEEKLVNGELLKMDALHKVRVIHAQLVNSHFEHDVYVSNTLIDSYVKCGSMANARHVFDSAPHRTVVSWTALIAGYAQQEQGQKALQLWAVMQEAGVEADEAAFLCLLRACSQVGALEYCSGIHRSLRQSGATLTLAVSNSLIHTYGRCGAMAQAQEVFDSLSHPNMVSWTALIAGYAWQGHYHTSLQRFEEMKQAGIQPGEVTFLSLLTACCHTGLVDKGLELFVSMCKNYSLTPTVRHHAILVDLLARSGLLNLAEKFLLSMTVQPDLAMWLSLLCACRNYKQVEIGIRAFQHAVTLEPAQSSGYVLMKDIYADAQMWDDVRLIEDMRTQAGAWKQPGQSWIEHENKVHVFVVGDTSHLQVLQIHAKLKEIRVLLQGHKEDGVQ